MPPIMTSIIRAMPASMIGELLSINTAGRLRAIPAQWEPLVTLGRWRTMWGTPPRRRPLGERVYGESPRRLKDDPASYDEVLAGIS
jgi:hypothetical protein